MNNNYANADDLLQRGLDPTPKHGDIVEWVGNQVQWTVDENDDLYGPSALCHWPDGGWRNVQLIERPIIREVTERRV